VCDLPPTDTVAPATTGTARPMPVAAWAFVLAAGLVGLLAGLRRRAGLGR